ncbi:cupin domain-containing protein [Ramlibacter sp.]|uniref:cupin domain-containing protein n=1 Tax=Ramlibacter sp. TaxID=1917967 RepID=UPI0017ED4D82|nr:cupin domain-containing protein [Ramlibacter sp.]MBA2676030.1 cupin domain-containing protein [Ramlibacter sp.]
MSRAAFASRDFAAVPGVLRADDDETQRLLHADVLGTGDGGGSDAFSGQRHHLVRVVDLPSRVLSMTIGGLEPGQGTRMHRHNYETILYILLGTGVSTIGGREVPWRAGDAVYIPVWAWHAHRNLSATEEALYVAAENAPMLQNLGIALREEK